MSTKSRGPKITPPQPRYRSRDVRTLRRTYHTLSYTKGGRALTAAERGGAKRLCNEGIQDR